MLIKKRVLMFLLVISVSAQANTWHEYYQAHEKEVGDAVASGVLALTSKNLFDLVGFDQVPGLNKLRGLYLNGNWLDSLEGIGNLPALEVLDLGDNQLQNLEGIKNLPSLELLNLSNNKLTTLAGIENLPKLQRLILFHNQLTTLEGIGDLPSLRLLNLANNELTFLEGIENLPSLKHVYFDDNPMPRAEEQLLNAIRSGQALPVVQRWFTWIRDDIVRAPYHKKIKIPAIRDNGGNNLLHLAVQIAAQRLARVRHKINSNKELAETERARQLQKYTTALNDFYTKILNILLSCDQECVHAMLYASNAQGQTVIESVLRRLGPDSPLVKVILNALSQSRQQEAEQKEKEQKNRAAEQG